MNTEFDFQASGDLIAWLPTRGNRVIILVSYNGQFVVSQYLPGATSWVQGYYFDGYDDALTCFALEAIGAIKPTSLPGEQTAYHLRLGQALADTSKAALE